MFNTMEVMLGTDDARRRTMDDGRRTLNTIRYHKLTGELKSVFLFMYIFVNCKTYNVEYILKIRIINSPY